MKTFSLFAADATHELTNVMEGERLLVRVQPQIRLRACTAFVSTEEGIDEYAITKEALIDYGARSVLDLGPAQHDVSMGARISILCRQLAPESGEFVLAAEGPLVQRYESQDAGLVLVPGVATIYTMPAAMFVPPAATGAHIRKLRLRAHVCSSRPGSKSKRHSMPKGSVTYLGGEPFGSFLTKQELEEKFELGKSAMHLLQVNDVRFGKNSILASQEPVIAEILEHLAMPFLGRDQQLAISLTNRSAYGGDLIVVWGDFEAELQPSAETMDKVAGLVAEPFPA